MAKNRQNFVKNAQSIFTFTHWNRGKLLYKMLCNLIIVNYRLIIFTKNVYASNKNIPASYWLLRADIGAYYVCGFGFVKANVTFN